MLLFTSCGLAHNTKCDYDSKSSFRNVTTFKQPVLKATYCTFDIHFGKANPNPNPNPIQAFNTTVRAIP